MSAKESLETFSFHSHLFWIFSHFYFFFFTFFNLFSDIFLARFFLCKICFYFLFSHLFSFFPPCHNNNNNNDNNNNNHKNNNNHHSHLETEGHEMREADKRCGNFFLQRSGTPHDSAVEEVCKTLALERMSHCSHYVKLYYTCDFQRSKGALLCIE